MNPKKQWVVVSTEKTEMSVVSFLRSMNSEATNSESSGKTVLGSVLTTKQNRLHV
jgi:hypothetical protein